MKKQPQPAAAEKPITEQVEVYPAGRGKILLLIKKSIPPKPKTYKHKQPRKTHIRIKCNPDDMTIIEYLDTMQEYPTRHLYLFPEKKELTTKELKHMALTILSILPRLTGKRLHGKSSNKSPTFLKREDYAYMRKNWKRYKNWRKRNT